MKKGNELIALNIIHKVMLAGQVLFAAIAFFLVYSNKVPTNAANDKIFQLLAIALSAAGVFGGTALFKKKLQDIRFTNGSVTEKFAAYRSAYITQWALLEGPCIFCLVAFFLVGNYSLFALAVVLILFFAMLAPSKAKAIIHLGLSEQEADEL
jgi:hypothetical protein